MPQAWKVLWDIGHEGQGLERHREFAMARACVRKVVREVRPHVVYCQHGGDVNRDHKLLFEAILVATRLGRVATPADLESTFGG